MEGIIETFHIDWKIILAQAINFGIVVAVFYFFALKPLTKLMAERADKIARGLEDAKKNAETLALTEVEKEEILTKARAEAQAIFNSGKRDTEAKKTEMLEEAKREVQKTIEIGKKALASEKEKMVNEAKGDVASLAMLAVEKIIAEKNK